MPDKRIEGTGAQERDVVWPRCIAAQYRHDFPENVTESAYGSPASDRSESRAMN
jgi:hypothetical protein